MTEEEILSKQTFINLFSKTGVDRIETEDQLFIQAKKLGIEKKFEKSLKKYEKLFSEKIGLGEDMRLPKSKYDVENYKMGKYICNVNGIIDTKTEYKFSYIPVLPVERYINKDTGKEKVKIIFFKENKWNELIVNKSQLSINQKLLQLSDDGLDVTSENVRYYINYFNEIMNINDIKKLESVSHLGWSNNDFIPYDSHGIFDGADEFRNIYKAFEIKGNFDKWHETIQKLRDHKIMKILMAVTLASPLLEKLGIQPYLVNLWSSLSGNGKTLSCMVAMSIWGNPDVGYLRLSSNNTQNYYTVVASFMRNITCYFDELQIVKNSKVLDLDNLIMDLCNGTEKGRLNKNSEAKEIKTWYNNFLFTSNDRLVKENAGEHVYNRVIDIEITEKLIENGQEIARVIRNNYGYAGKKYINYIKSIDFNTIFSRYKKIYEEVVLSTKSTDKQASALASILLANELGNECIFNDDYILTIDDILELVNDKNEIKTSNKAKEYILNVISANKSKFDADNRYSEKWGRIKEEWEGNDKVILFVINAEILYRELKKGGFEFNTVKKEWAEMGFLKRSASGRYVIQTSLNTEYGTYVILRKK